MAERDKTLNHDSGLLKIISGGMGRLFNRNTSFQTGFCWLFGYIIILLVTARIIFWYHSWNFSWMPEQLHFLLLFFLVVHLVIGIPFIFVCDVACEMKKICCHLPCRPVGAFLTDFIKKYFNGGYLLCGVIAYFLVYTTLVGYTNLKPAIPLLNHNLYDNLLFQVDRILFHILSAGGVISIPKNPGFTQFFNNIYFALWFVTCLTLSLSYRNKVDFWRFAVAWCLALGLAMPIAILFPSLGPAFYKPDLFSHIQNTHSATAMEFLWHNYILFKNDPFNSSIVVSNGITAMPSLHISFIYLSVISLKKHFPTLHVLFWGILVVFIMSTVYLGWHYISDGIVGIILGQVSYKISTLWFCRREHVSV